MTSCIDVMCINEIGFVTSVSHLMHHHGCHCAAQNNAFTFHKALDKMPQVCNEGRCQIKTIKCEQEFQSAMDNMADDLGVNVNCANTQDHMAVAEQNNCIIKESMHQCKLHVTGVGPLMCPSK